jgi:hypothetical protein
MLGVRPSPLARLELRFTTPTKHSVRANLAYMEPSALVIERAAAQRDRYADSAWRTGIGRRRVAAMSLGTWMVIGGDAGEAN